MVNGPKMYGLKRLPPITVLQPIQYIHIDGVDFFALTWYCGLQITFDSSNRPAKAVLTGRAWPQ